MILIFFSVFCQEKTTWLSRPTEIDHKNELHQEIKGFWLDLSKTMTLKTWRCTFWEAQFFYDFWNWESLTACAVLAFEPKSGCYWPPTVWFLHSAMGHFLRILEEREEQLQKNIHKYCFFALYLDQYNLHTYAPIKKETSGLYTWHQTSYYISCCIFMTNKNPNTILSGCVPQPKTKITCNIEKSR